MPTLKSLAAGTPDYDRWVKVTQALDATPAGDQEAAVREFEAASAHWPTTLDPWTGMNLAPGIELRRSPTHWVREIYAGQHAPKHDAVRILESPRRPMREQKLECLLDPAARLRNVVQVGFDQAKVSGGFLKALKGEGAWQRWRALRLWTCDMKAPALKALGAADLGGLEQLNLEQNRMGEAGLSGLSKAPGLGALTAVHLGSNDLDASAARALGQMEWARRLTWLNLQYNKLFDAALDQLADGGATRQLRWLSLSQNHVGAVASRWMSALPALESLQVNNTALTAAGLEALLAQSPALHTLNVAATDIGDAGARAIAASGRRFRSLALGMTGMTPAGLGAILRSPAVEDIERLELGAGLDLANAQLLVAGACPRLKFLWWHGPELGEGAEAALRGHPRTAATLPY
jgi:hypothetical protein